MIIFCASAGCQVLSKKKKETAQNSEEEYAAKKYNGMSWFLIVVYLAFLIAAIVVAYKCNRNKGTGTTVLYMILAFVFPEIYLIQHVIRKYMIKSEGYCCGIDIGDNCSYAIKKTQAELEGKPEAKILSSKQ